MYHVCILFIDVYVKQTVGWSAVFFAAKEGHLEVTKLLIKAGANVTLKDKVQHCKCNALSHPTLYMQKTLFYISQNNVTALSLASVHGMKEVCTLLEAHIPSKETLAPQVSYRIIPIDYCTTGYRLFSH